MAETLGTLEAAAEHAAGLDRVGASADGSGDGTEEWAPHLHSVTDVKLDPELLRQVRRPGGVRGCKVQGRVLCSGL